MEPLRNRNETRPAKRQRMGDYIPEGFLKSTTMHQKPIRKSVVPNFASAFDEHVQPTARGNTSVFRDSEKRLPAQRVLSAPDRSAFKENVDERADASNSSRPKQRKVVSVKDVHHRIVQSVADKLVPQTKLRPVSRVPPPAPVAVASSSKPPMKRIEPPSFPRPQTPSRALMPIQPPVNLIIPGRKALPKENMCTITTTGFGRLTDLSSENGVDELATILLRDQHPELSNGGDNMNPHLRGLELSPDRKGKGKASKFIRGGLAARASAHFDQTRTGFVLWLRQKELEMQRAHNLPSGADITATIVKVLFSPFTTTSSRSESPTSLVALCQIRQPNGYAHISFKSTHLYRVAFTFLGVGTGKCNPQKLVDGDVVRIFKPWNEMGPSERKDGHGDKSNLVRRLPASLPLPSSAPFSTPDPLDAPVHDTVIFCTRFIVCGRQ